jgi:hypothetical protein
VPATISNHPRRRGPTDPLLRYIERVGHRFRVRVPAADRRINLGSYPSLHDARRALRHWIVTGRVPECVLPRWVRLVPIGKRRLPGYYFLARFPGGGGMVGPFDSAEDAALAARLHVQSRAGRRAGVYLGTDREQRER